MPKTVKIPTRREFQMDIPMCWVGGRCCDRFQSIDGKRNYICSNCRVGHQLKQQKTERKNKEKKE